MRVKWLLNMQLSQSTSMRQEMRQLLTPRMIQSMEILQIPLMALEERIEQELVGNPVLEMREGDPDAIIATDTQAEAPTNGPEQTAEGEQALIVRDEENGSSDEVNRLQ